MRETRRLSSGRLRIVLITVALAFVVASSACASSAGRAAPVVAADDLVLTYQPVAGTLTAAQVAADVTVMRGLVQSDGYDADVATSGGGLLVMVHRVTAANKEAVLAKLSLRERVQLRPVLQCVADTGEPAATGAAASDPTRTELLKTFDTRNPELCQVGPAGGDGTVFAEHSAQAQIIGGGWGVTATLASGAAGEGVWNALAAECYSGEASCPSRRLAIEVDGIIQSAPTVNAPQFTGEVQITGSFSTTQAKQLAAVINSDRPPAALRLTSAQYGANGPLETFAVVTTLAAAAPPVITVAAADTTVAPGPPLPCPNADGSSPRHTTFPAAPTMCIDVHKTYTATVVTNRGRFTIALDPLKAPLTVNNFVYLARYHFYDNTICHRIIQGFVVQCGDPTGTGSGGPGYSFPDELPKAGDYHVGSVAMANSGPDTNGSQIFVVTGAQGAALPPSYSLFGAVTDGLGTTVKVLDSLGSADSGGTPTQPVTIQQVTIAES